MPKSYRSLAPRSEQECHEHARAVRGLLNQAGNNDRQTQTAGLMEAWRECQELFLVAGDDVDQRGERTTREPDTAWLRYAIGLRGQAGRPQG